jgi:predicted phosphodiesterase
MGVVVTGGEPASNDSSSYYYYYHLRRPREHDGNGRVSLDASPLGRDPLQLELAGNHYAPGPVDVEAEGGATQLAFFAGVYANTAALRAVLKDLRRRGVDKIYCLGDVVGFGGDPAGTVKLLRDEGIPTLVGRCDDGVAFERGEYGCFYESAEARRKGEASYTFTASALSDEDKAWLRSLPQERQLDVHGKRLHLAHVTGQKINERFLMEPGLEAVEGANSARPDVLVLGDPHTVWHRWEDGVLRMNVGSVGRPQDDDPRAPYSILHLRAGDEPRVEVVRVPYERDETSPESGEGLRTIAKAPRRRQPE